jgi:hypothetical protein
MPRRRPITAIRMAVLSLIPGASLSRARCSHSNISCMLKTEVEYILARKIAPMMPLSRPKADC